MLNLLRKLFIKNYNDVTNQKVREKHGTLASLFGMFTNLLLFVLKIIIGLMTFTMSIITDAINNLSDMASCIISLVGFKLSSKPADKEHPFGHQRIEYIAGLIVSFFIIALAIISGYTSILKIINKESTSINNPVVFIILVLAILMKLWQSIFYKKMSKLINSVSLKANSQDSLNDVISTSCVLAVTIFIYFMKDRFDWLYLVDPIVGILLSLFIVIMGIKLVIETANPLIGVSPDKDLVHSIVKDITSYKGVLGIHDMVVHSYGPTSLFMSIHVEVDSSNNVLDSHDLIDSIEHDISEKYKIELVIHMDPIVVGSKIIKKIKENIESTLSSHKYVNYKITFHDLRVVEGTTHTNIIFDVVVPNECKINKEEIKNDITNNIKTINKKYMTVIKIDNSYVDY